ncbi:glutamate--tRNA ligase, cytoplasmic [Artemisia annua]|uniref:Glutamate--tRNA ligase, cytoplasmic n=1 Tax=Artemisia annua TaxID=35608 RepID=A0A2U1LQP7_ARTAN|nr:glutamate--tRNA ligase, cytoplasmic [Artemisia annua]
MKVVVKDEQDIDPNDQNSVLEHLDNVLLDLSFALIFLTVGFKESVSYEEIKKDSDGNVKELKGVLHPKGLFKATKLKLTCIPELKGVAGS